MKRYNTNTVEKTRFRQHGQLEWEAIEEGILLYTAYGPFNKELLEAAEFLEKESFPKLKESWVKWGEIVVFKQSCMILDDAFDDYKEFMKDCKKNDMAPIASAYVFEPGIEGKLISPQRYREVYQYAGIKYQDFSSVEEALVWVKSKLRQYTHQ